MRRFLVASFAVAAMSFSAPASVQAQQCAAGSDPLADDACAVGRDFLLYMAPQLGTSLVGGSHTIGLNSNMGGFPRFAIALRGNAVQGSRPVIDNLSPGAATVKDFETEDQILGLPAVDFALGITKGFNLGVTRIGGIDLIGGATYVPEFEEQDFSLAAPDGSLSLAYGARVGLLQQSAFIPGIAFSWMKRDMPTLDLTSTIAGGDQLSITNLAIKSTSWRLSAQKNFLLFQFGAGIGGDNYDFNADVAASVDAGTTNGSFNASQKMDRTTMYGTVGINLFLFKIVGEVGQVSGGSAPTFNNFAVPADTKRTYGTIGIRFGK